MFDFKPRLVCSPEDSGEHIIENLSSGHIVVIDEYGKDSIDTVLIPLSDNRVLIRKVDKKNPFPQTYKMIVDDLDTCLSNEAMPVLPKDEPTILNVFPTYAQEARIAILELEARLDTLTRPDILVNYEHGYALYEEIGLREQCEYFYPFVARRGSGIVSQELTVTNKEMTIEHIQQDLEFKTCSKMYLFKTNTSEVVNFLGFLNHPTDDSKLLIIQWRCISHKSITLFGGKPPIKEVEHSKFDIKEHLKLLWETDDSKFVSCMEMPEKWVSYIHLNLNRFLLRGTVEIPLVCRNFDWDMRRRT